MFPSPWVHLEYPSNLGLFFWQSFEFVLADCRLCGDFYAESRQSPKILAKAHAASEDASSKSR
jgi:hypothetical protein